MIKYIFILSSILMFGATTNRSNDLNNLIAFSKSYGYVKYFHPSYEANQVDWNKFAVYGVGKISKCKNKEERVKVLNEIFQPIGPSIVFSSIKEQYNFDSMIPDDIGQYQPVFWQHYGVTTGQFPQYPYQSQRVNGYSLVDMSDKNGWFSNSIDIKKYQGKDIKFSCWVKAKSESGSTGHLYFSVEIADKVYGSSDYMAQEPIFSSEWEKYEIIGNVDSIGSKLHFGSYLNGKGSFLIDDVKLSVNENGKWKEIQVAHSDFESDFDNITSIQSGWYKSGKGYNVNVNNTDSYSGKNCIEIAYEGKKKSLRNPPIFSTSPKFGELINKELGDGIYCSIPLTVYGKEKNTYPTSNTFDDILKDLGEVDESPNKVNVRLGNIINTYNVFQHFFPYFDDVDVDWDKEFVSALQRCYSDQSEKDHLITLQKFTAKLKDGHIFVLDDKKEWFSPPITWEWIEGKLIITEVLNSEIEIRVGDIVTEINDQSAKDYFSEIYSRISAGTEGYLNYIAHTSSLLGKKDTELKVVINDKTYNLKRKQSKYEKKGIEIRKHTYVELDDGIVYLNLSNINTDTINKIMPILEMAKGIICDGRGYFSSELLPYLMVEKDTSDNWYNIAKIIYPDQENIAGYSSLPWNLEPIKPYLGDKKVVFMTNAKAVSSSESSLSFVKHYSLGTIIGQPTAGANGAATTFPLLGNITIRWTGSKVVKHDGSQHFAVGILPDVTLEKTIAGVRAGRDEYLIKALEIINTK